MKNKLISYLQEIVAEKGGIYTTFFGNEDDASQIHTEVTINWILNNDHDLKHSVEIILQHITSQILQSYKSFFYTKDFISLDDSKIILFNSEVIKNPFIPLNYEIINPDVKLADLENYLNDIQVTESSTFIQIHWKFPIYKCQDIMSFIVNENAS